MSQQIKQSTKLIIERAFYRNETVACIILTAVSLAAVASITPTLAKVEGIVWIGNFCALITPVISAAALWFVHIKKIQNKIVKSAIFIAYLIAIQGVVGLYLYSNVLPGDYGIENPGYISLTIGALMAGALVNVNILPLILGFIYMAFEIVFLSIPPSHVEITGELQDFLHEGVICYRIDIYKMAGIIVTALIMWGISRLNAKMIGEMRDYNEESERRLRITEIYTRKSIVEIIEDGEDPTTFEPRLEKISILFSDVRQFTNLSENLKPIEVVDLLNLYFNKMNKLIIDNQGEIDKLIGDCIMALFRDPDHSIKSAIAMRKELERFNKEQKFSKNMQIDSGIGINFGEIVIGNIGSQSKMDYTVIGDIVNSASRMEALTKYYMTPIIISEELKTNLKGDYHIRFLDNVQVKGKKVTTKIYEVYEADSENIIKLKQTLEPHLDKAFEIYSKGDFEKAALYYKKLMNKIGKHPLLENKCKDPIINFYHSRCINLLSQQKAGLIKSWNGVFEFVDK